MNQHPINRQALQQFLQDQGQAVWRDLCRMYPRLVGYRCPEILLNARLTRTAGRCFTEQNRVELGFKFFLFSQEYFHTMVSTILPHELIHQADFVLFGESEKPCGHGKNWQNMMVKYGLPPDKYHDMDIR